MKKIKWLLYSLLLFTGCSHIKKIPHTPEITPEQWLATQPYVHVQFGNIDFIWMQPSSTFFVYLLGLSGLFIGIRFLKKRSQQASVKWWGYAMILWGFSALSAGTSYQAFSYEIKCAGQAICSWTSYWEIVYLFLTVSSIAAMMVSVAHAYLKDKSKKWLINYSFILAAVYLFVLVIGVITLNSFLISFEFMILLMLPHTLLMFGISLKSYLKAKCKLDLTFIWVWIILGMSVIIYFATFVMGLGEFFWQRGIWFNANDALHIVLLVWMFYIYKYLPKVLTDKVLK